MNSRNKTFILLLICILVVWKTYSYLNHVETIEKLENDDPILLQRLKQMQGGDASDNVKITVYYEALCSDSRNFVLRELLPTYQLLSKHTTLDMVPYGKARTIEKDDGKLEFHCQHGEIECLGNKVHACTIALVSDPMKMLEMVACMIDDNIIPFDATERCAKEHGVSYEDIAACTNSPRSSELLRQHGIRTDKIRPSFIPTVQLNGEMKVPLTLILKDLKKQVCDNYVRAAPKECA